MQKYSLKFAALMASILVSSLAITACGDDDDSDAPDTPIENIECARPTSITYDVTGNEYYSLSYNSDGRVSKISFYEYRHGNQQLYREVTVSYSPFKYVDREWSFDYDWDNEHFENVENYLTMTMSDAKFDSRGLITKMKITEDYEGDTDVYSATMEYDSEGHLTSITSDGEKAQITWNNGNLINYGGYIRYSYSEQKNTAGNAFILPFIGTMAEFWLTGLFGVVPANLPDKFISADDDEVSYFSYDLNSDGSIKSCTATYPDGYSSTYNYFYGARSIDYASAESAPVRSPKRFTSPLRKLLK